MVDVGKECPYRPGLYPAGIQFVGAMLGMLGIVAYGFTFVGYQQVEKPKTVWLQVLPRTGAGDSTLACFSWRIVQLQL
jgi:hypothetical protein